MGQDHGLGSWVVVMGWNDGLSSCMGVVVMLGSWFRVMGWDHGSVLESAQPAVSVSGYPGITTPQQPRRLAFDRWVEARFAPLRVVRILPRFGPSTLTVRLEHANENQYLGKGGSVSAQHRS